MVAANPPGTNAYGQPLGLPDGSVLVADESGVPVLGPVINGASGTAVQNIINAALGQGAVGGSGVPVLNAILIEFRVQNNLLLYSLGATALDIEQMRADEAYNVSLSSGAQTL